MTRRRTTLTRPPRTGGGLPVPALVASGGVLLAAAAIVLWWLWRRNEPRGGAQWAAEREVRGLSEAEAAGRRSPLDLRRVEAKAQWRVRRAAVRSNLLTVFNVDMVGLALLMFLLGSPLSGLGTTAVLTANVGARVFQELRARRHQEELLRAVAHKATVIREGTPHRLPTRDIVIDDLTAVGLGDAVPTDSVIVSASGLLLTGPGGPTAGATVRPLAGEAVPAGSYCIGGHALLRATEAGAARVAELLDHAEFLAPAQTALTVLIRRTLYVLLAIAMVFSLLLLTDHLIPIGLPGSEEAYRNALSLVFGVAPTSLFFVLVLGYVLGMEDVAARGGLVFRQSEVDALAQLTTVRLATRSVISGAQVALRSLLRDGAGAEGRTDDEMARRLLGDFVQSVDALTPTNELLAVALPGSTRQPLQTAGHLSIYGWQAATFDDPDMRGTYVIGVPEVLGTGSAPDILAQAAEVVASTANASAETARGAASRVGRWLGRLRPGGVPPAATAEGAAARGPADPGETGEDASDTPPSSSPDLLGRARDWVGRQVGARSDEPDDEPASIGSPRRLLFAHHPAIEPLVDAAGRPQLPGGLQPVAELSVGDSVGKDAVRAVDALRRSGLAVAMVDDSDPDLTIRTAATLGLPIETWTGREGGAAATAGSGTNAGARVIVASPRHPPSAQDVTIALRTASQVALGEADLILLEDSIAALPRILAAARRATNGIMAVLKINLSQIATQLGLLALVLVAGYARFVYSSLQSGAITAFSIGLPGIVLLRLAPSTLGGNRHPALSLARFVLPNAVATIALSVAVYVGFLEVWGKVATAQLAVTWALIAAGLVRLLMAIPPSRLWAQAEERVGDQRMYAVAGISATLFLGATAIPTTRGWLGLGWLPSAASYAVLAALVLTWAALQLAFWRWIWRRPAGRPVGTPTSASRGAAATERGPNNASRSDSVG